MSKHKLFCGACRSRLFPQAGEENGVLEPDREAPRNNHLHLAGNLFDELQNRGEIELRASKVPRGGKLTCRRCRRVWVAQYPQEVPALCPECGAKEWSAFRLFKCRLCGQEFTSYSLHRNAYELFAHCPACGRARWHAGLESSPLANLLRLLKTKG